MNLDAIEQRREAAWAEVIALCKGPGVRRWTMTIPAEPTRDSDLVIGAALDDSKALLEQNRKLAEALDLLIKARHETAHNGDIVQAGDYEDCEFCAPVRDLLAEPLPGTEVPRP